MKSLKDFVGSIFLPLSSLILCALAFVCSGFAQTPNGSLRGEVQDPSGARIVSAKILVRAQAASFERSSSSGNTGDFRLDGLLPGDYKITVSAAGFADAHAVVTVSVSSVRDIMVTLKPAASYESVMF